MQLKNAHGIIDHPFGFDIKLLLLVCVLNCSATSIKMEGTFTHTFTGFPVFKIFCGLYALTIKTLLMK